jgi:drug/metabolite transporter (DMT)-like permease
VAGPLTAADTPPPPAPAGGLLVNLALSSALREVAAAEEALPRSSHVALAHALPAAPVLLAGLLCLEGQELVEHELSVPAVTLVLLSAAAFTLAAAAALLLEERLAPAHKSAVRALCLAGTIVLDFLERAHALGALPLLGVGMAVAGSVAAGWAQRQQRVQLGAHARVSAGGEVALGEGAGRSAV